MAIYTVRPKLSLSLNRIIYPPGSQVELTNAQAKFYGHLIEESSADPEPPSSSINSDYATALEQINSRIDGLDTANNNCHDTHGRIYLNLPSLTWTNFTDRDLNFLRVLDELGNDLTDSFAYRKDVTSGQWQIYSLVSLNNLTILFHTVNNSQIT